MLEIKSTFQSTRVEISLVLRCWAQNKLTKLTLYLRVHFIFSVNKYLRNILLKRSFLYKTYIDFGVR